MTDDKWLTWGLYHLQVSTGLGNEAIIKEGKITIEEKFDLFKHMNPIKPEESASGLLKYIEMVNREESHDKFYSNAKSIKEGKLVETPW